MATRYVDSEGAKKILTLSTSYTDSSIKTASDSLQDDYNEKIASMVDSINLLSESMVQMQNNVNTQITEMSTAIQNMSDNLSSSISTINNKIDTMHTSLESQIGSLQQDFDNIDTQVNNINTTVNNLSSDMADVKAAMQDMVVNIENDPDTGNFIVYHYDGTIVRSKVVDSISNDIIDLIAASNGDSDGDGEID